MQLYKSDGAGGIDPVLNPPDTGKEKTCPCCGRVADEYFRREFEDEIIGCEHCLVRMMWYEI